MRQVAFGVFDLFDSVGTAVKILVPATFLVVGILMVVLFWLISRRLNLPSSFKLFTAMNSHNPGTDDASGLMDALGVDMENTTWSEEVQTADGVVVSHNIGNFGNATKPGECAIDRMHRAHQITCFTVAEEMVDTTRYSKKVIRNYKVELNDTLVGGLKLQAVNRSNRGTRMALEEFTTGHDPFDEKYMKTADDPERAAEVLTESGIIEVLMILADEFRDLRIDSTSMVVTSDVLRSGEEKLMFVFDLMLDVLRILEGDGVIPSDAQLQAGLTDDVSTAFRSKASAPHEENSLDDADADPNSDGAVW